MKKLIIASAILLAGCGAKQATDPNSQQVPATGDQPAVQSATQAQGQGASPAQTAYQNQPPQYSRNRDRGQQPDQQYDPSSQQEYSPPQEQPVVSVYLDPPLEEPAPVQVSWAPPPMLVETPPPPPSDEDVWTGGYWAWEGNWVWAHGRWAPPPRHGYRWNNPYYEHRGDSVVFVNGYWGAPGTTFVAPSLNVNIALAVIAVGILAGPRPEGPAGVFIPPPPGSRFGLIVPAPMGTSPAVVTGAPPIVRVGMHVTINNNNVNNTRISNVTNVTNITNVTVVAPASATANGRAVEAAVSGIPHLAAAQVPVVKAVAPMPASSKAIPAYVAGRPPIALPAPQIVRPVVPASFAQPVQHDQPNTPSHQQGELPGHPEKAPMEKMTPTPIQPNPPVIAPQAHNAVPAPAAHPTPEIHAGPQERRPEAQAPAHSEPPVPITHPAPEAEVHPKPNAGQPQKMVPNQEHPVAKEEKPVPQVNHPAPPTLPKPVQPPAKPQPLEQHKPEQKNPKEIKADEKHDKE